MILFLVRIMTCLNLLVGGLSNTSQPVEKVTYSLSFMRKTALLAQGSKLRNAFCND